MTFLNPLILLALAAAAIPIVVHLFHFRRPQSLPFSSLAFLKSLQQNALERLRIRQWLLLLLRVLALVCLVVAFARPVVRGPLAAWIGGRSATAVGLVVDNSPSMQVRDAQGAYFEQAQAIARGILEQLGTEASVCLISVAGVPRPVMPLPRPVALERLEGLTVHYGAEKLSEAIREVQNCLKQTGTPGIVYVISDLQASTLSDSLAQPIQDPAPIVLIPIGGQTPANVAVIEVRLESQIIEQGQPVHITATLANYGTAPVADVVVALELDGQRAAQVTVDLPAGGTTRVSFTAVPTRQGWLEGMVRLLQPDALLDDNARALVLHVPETRRLLLVAGLGSRTEYLELALSPEIRQDRVRFEVTRIEEPALAAFALQDYDVVVLAGVRDLSSGEIAQLSRYVAEGGGLLWFPGRDIRLEDYQALLRQLEAGQVRGLSGRWNDPVPIATFDRVDLAHPVFEHLFVRLPGQQAVRIERPAVYAALEYVAGRGDEHTLIQLSNGLPLLQEIRHGRGRVLLWTIGPDPGWSELPLRGLFVPLLYRAVFYLSAQNEFSDGLLLAGRPVTLRVVDLPANTLPELVSREGLVYRATPVYQAGAAVLRFDPGPPYPGVYLLRAGDSWQRQLAVHMAAEESDLRPMEAEEAVQQLRATLESPVTLLRVAHPTPEGVAGALHQAQTGTELWSVFLWLALGFLALEMWVALRTRMETVAMQAA